MIYLILIANCLAMVLGIFVTCNKQYELGIICFLISFFGFSRLYIELDKNQKIKAKKIKKSEIFKPKLRKDKKISLESHRLNKFN